MLEIEGVEPSRMEELYESLEQFKDSQMQRHRGNYRAGVLLVGFGLCGSVAVSAAGFLNYGVAAGLIGLVVALCIGLQSAYSFGEKAEFQRIMATEGDNLLLRLRVDVKSPADFESVVKEFLVLRTFAAKSIPRGKGMEAVHDMAKELKTEH